tara:strand:- start:1731 stop:2111 length:381 start_codon:yes stop_codon:yes gene_type:complete
MENFKLIEERENKLFKRKEIKFEVQAEVTPSRIEVGKLITKEFSTTLDKVKIKKIHGKFGSKKFSVEFFIYETEDDKNKTESKRKKDSLLTEKPKEEKVEEKAQENKPIKEKPAEENKEDIKEDKQ